VTHSAKAPKVVVVGKDARTDAMAAACLASAAEVELYAMSDMLTPGLEEKCKVFRGAVMDRDFRRRVIGELRPDLVLVGPEEPLADGFVDELEAEEIPAFGPSAELARIESSKSWAREVLDRHGIPGNPQYRVITDRRELRSYMQQLGDFVIKPDGLTAGKGVRVFGEHISSIEEALAYAERLVEEDGRVQIEERLDGEEFSLQTITDGSSFLHCPLVQDHKRALEHDRGVNTGGMGSYSCADHSLPFLTGADVAAAHSISERVVEALAREAGRPYRGVLYGGFIATASGVQLIEYNARFGDPEAMNVLPLLEGDFVELCTAVTRGELGGVEASFAAKATVCKYVVPSLYPEPVPHPGRISVPAEAWGEDTHWYWAACEKKQDHVALTGSRSGAAVGIGDSLEQAEQLAERAASAVEGDVRHRSDIGRREIVAARASHMAALRSAATPPLKAHAA
jgi:phosphoribosylamine---glycine ligase